MAEHQLKNLTDIEDFVRGATFLGTGGGGDPTMGRQILKTQLANGKALRWVDAAAIPSDVYTACAFGMGSIAPQTEEGLAKMRSFGLDPAKPLLGRIEYLSAAVRALENHVGIRIGALVPGELGGGNSASGVALAAELGVLAVDGDYAGRALPEIQQASPCLKGKRLTPLASCDSWGNCCVIEHTINHAMAERIGKMISVAGFAGCGMAGFLMKAADMREAVYPSTMTESLLTGRCIRETREQGIDPVEALACHVSGRILCRGVVTQKEWSDQDGYYLGYHTITGKGDFTGTVIKIWLKNENHIAWKNGEVCCLSPDSINVVDNITAEPYTNPAIAEGHEVAVIVMRARPLHRTPEGIKALAPRVYGFNLDYTPLEVLMR